MLAKVFPYLCALLCIDTKVVMEMSEILSYHEWFYIICNGNIYLFNLLIDMLSTQINYNLHSDEIIKLIFYAELWIGDII